jgi:hypothetical protein
MNQRTTVHSLLEVRTEPDGAVVIGRPPVGAAGLVLIAVAGGLLAVDPMAPHGPGELRVGDPSQVTVIEAVYGPEVAAAVKAADDGPLRLPLVASPVRDALVSIAVLRWLGARCPIALDRPLLTAEENVLAARLGDLLDEDHTPLEGTPALRELEVRLADWHRLEEVRHSAWAVIDELSPQSTPVMGKNDSLVLRGWGPVDWDRTPPTVTSRTEDAVSWRIMAQTGGDLLTVVVKAFPPSPHAELLDAPPPPPTELQATLHSSAWPQPLAVVELTSRPENGAFMGSGRLDPDRARWIRNAEGSALSVEVHARGVPHRPRCGTDAGRAAAVRWATRGLCCLRLASVAPPDVRHALTTTGAEALAFAARRYGELPDGAGAAAQCMALVPASADDRQYWIPDDIEPDPNTSGPGSDPVGGAARATAAETWYVAAAPLPVRREGP